MTDPRLTPNPAYMSRSEPAQIGVKMTDLCRSPAGPRDRQLICGDHVTVLGALDRQLYVQSAKDGYVGFVAAPAVTAQTQPTHTVAAPATHAYSQPNFKSPDITALTFGSRLTAQTDTGAFLHTDLGFVPRQHLRPIEETFHDPAAVAALFLGTPYLWGGNTRAGIDCSGLVQAALIACGLPCPGDSDMQQSLGSATDGPYQRNDLLFWKGHVALVSSPDTLIHANAGAMATVYEGITAAITRIADQGDGCVIAHRRLHALSGKINSPPEA